MLLLQGDLQDNPQGILSSVTPGIRRFKFTIDELIMQVNAIFGRDSIEEQEEERWNKEAAAQKGAKKGVEKECQIQREDDEWMLTSLLSLSLSLFFISISFVIFRSLLEVCPKKVSMYDA